MSSPPIIASDPATLRERHVQAKRAATAAMIDRIGWSAEQLATRRRDGLRAVLRDGKAGSSWHRSRLADVDPDRFEEQDIADLPTMTKDDVMAAFDQIVTDPRLTLAGVETHLASLSDAPRHLLDRYQAIASGGSSGVRGVFVYDWDAWVTCYLGWFRYLLRDVGGKPLSAALVAAGKPTHASRALLQTLSDPDEIAIHSVPITLPVGQIVRGLNDLQPDTLLAYPSALVQLVEAARGGELRITPRALVTGGEPLLPETRAAAEACFGVPILNWYLCSEVGPIAIGCGQSPGLHLSDDLLIIESVDDDNRPVASGERCSKVLVTSLYNPALPIIRYELSDEITMLDERCPCGSEHRLIADPYGRADDSFRYEDIVVHPHVFRSILGRRPGIAEYQVRQTRAGADIAIRGDANTQALAAQLRRGLEDLGLRRPPIQITTVTQIERQDTGKIRRFLPLPTSA